MACEQSWERELAALQKAVYMPRSTSSRRVASDFLFFAIPHVPAESESVQLCTKTLDWSEGIRISLCVIDKWRAFHSKGEGTKQKAMDLLYSKWWLAWGCVFCASGVPRGSTRGNAVLAIHRAKCTMPEKYPSNISFLSFEFYKLYFFFFLIKFLQVIDGAKKPNILQIKIF